MLVRVLVTSSPMAGHFAPLLPFISACYERGDDVVLVVPEAARTRAEETGVSVVIGASPDPAEVDRLWREFRRGSPEKASVIANREIFGRLNTAAMLPAVEQAIAEHQPEMVLHEPTEYAGPIAAMRAGARHAQVAISLAAVEDGSLSIAAPALERYGPVVAALRAAPYLTRFPAAIDPSPYSDTRRYREPSPLPRQLPDWWDGCADPLVYVTFGTVAAAVGIGAYRAAAEALASLPVRVLISTGQHLNLGPMPSNIHVRPWVDQHEALAEAAVVVCHGGSGTTLGALAAGVPMVIFAMFADQTRNAQALESLGVAVLIEANGTSASERATYDPIMVPALRAAVERILHDAQPRTAAERVARELGLQPTPSALLTRLA